MNVRKPPVDEILALHLPRLPGKCVWCGNSTGDLKHWHPACKIEFQIVTNPSIARDAVLERDHGICAQCGQDWSQRFKFRAQYTPGNAGHVTGPLDARYCPIIAIPLWHNDHKTPLWEAVHLPPIQRIEFFKLAAMQTLCDACHQIKCRKEEARSAHLDRMAGPKKESFSRFPQRRMRSRSMRQDFKPRVRDINDE